MSIDENVSGFQQRVKHLGNDDGHENLAVMYGIL